MPYNSRIKRLNLLIRGVGKVIYIKITVLFVALSIVCFFLAFQSINLPVNITSIFEDINKYGNIFTITIALITVGLILNQIKLAVIANKLTPQLKWTEKFEIFLKDEKPSSQKISSMIQNYFLKNAEGIFDFLYASERPMKISNKTELISFFNQFLKTKVREFELDSDGYHQNNRTYKSLGTSYSFTDIQKILRFVLKSTNNYQTLESDFSRLYISEVDKMNEELNKQQ